LPVNPLALLPDLRPWHEAGLSFLYHAQSTALPPCDEYNPGPAAVSAHSQPSAHTPKAAEKPAVSSETPSLPVEQPASMRLPPPWQRMLERIKPAPVIWTYAELGRDMLEQGHAARSNLLRRMLSELKLPLGSNTFLPLTLPGLDPKDQSRERDIFAWMFQRLGGKVLILLGQSALALSPYAESDLQQYQEKILQGNLVLCLPDMDNLIQNERTLAMALGYLRSALVGFNSTRFFSQE